MLRCRKIVRIMHISLQSPSARWYFGNLRRDHSKEPWGLLTDHAPAIWFLYGPRLDNSEGILMKKMLAASLLALGFASAPAFAEEGGEWSGNFAVTTDYVFRGITQSNGDWSISGGFDYAESGFYAGSWWGSIDFGDTTDANVEWDLYAGLTPSWNGLDFDFGGIYYIYPDADNNDYNFFELYAGVSKSLDDAVSVGAKFAYSPDFFGATGTGTYTEGNIAFALTEVVSLDAAVGYQTIDEDEDYTTFNLGATVSMNGFDLDFRYHDADYPGIDDAFVISLGRSF
jgi:uncharacterized protein (TIGR02001 family)